MRRALCSAAALAVMLGGCATAQTNIAAVSAPVPKTGGEADAPDTMRWLYGSGEAAGASIQAYRAMADYALARAKADPAQSVTMGLPDAEGGTGTISCTAPGGAHKQPAVIFDVDETVILNRGFEYWTSLGNSYNREAWNDWAANGAPYVAPVPGAVTGLKRLRDAGIAVIFNTNRDSEHAAGTQAAIEAVGLGPAIHGETLFMKGDDAMGSRKDGRRATIAAKYCVVALAGDNLGDFADLFNDKALPLQTRREKAARGTLAQLWGNGWFALPNSAYGAWQYGTVDDVFPPDARWTPPAEAAE